MNFINLVASFRDRVGDESFPARKIESLAEEGGLERFAETMAESEHAKELQRTDVNVALDVEGIADVPADFLTGYISRIRHPDVAQDLIILADPAEFNYIFNSEFGYAAIESKKIYTKPPAGYTGGAIFLTAIRATGIFIPTIATVPQKREGIFLDLLVEMYQESIKLNRPGRDNKKTA
ncbi:MAG: hypothetical protein WBV94_21705 [Blastocatellia bacterium]